MVYLDVNPPWWNNRRYTTVVYEESLADVVPWWNRTPVDVQALLCHLVVDQLGQGGRCRLSKEFANVHGFVEKGDGRVSIDQLCKSTDLEVGKWIRNYSTD